MQEGKETADEQRVQKVMFKFRKNNSCGFLFAHVLYFSNHLNQHILNISNELFHI